MNVLSLPDEMLASVTKYTNKKKQLKLRRLSKRLDGVTKKYKLNREMFSSIKFTKLHNDYGVQVEHKLGSRSRSTLNEKNGSFDLRMEKFEIEKVMDHVEKVDVLEFSQMVIDESTINKLSKYAKAIRGHALHFSLCEINISAEKLKNFVNQVKLSKLEVRYCTFPDEKSLSDELLAEISPSTSLILTGVNAPKITILSMERRHSSNGLLSLETSKTGITFEDMMKFIKANSLKCNIDFGILNEPAGTDVSSFLFNEFADSPRQGEDRDDRWTSYYVRFKIHFATQYILSEIRIFFVRSASNL